MNKLFLLLPLLLIGCATKQQRGKYLGKVRTTYYCAAEDKKWGDKVAMCPKLRAVAGITVAVDPKKIPYGTHINIPELGEVFGDPYFVAQDCGSAVSKMTASHGKTLVIDIYVDNRHTMNYFARNNEQYMDAFLLE